MHAGTLRKKRKRNRRKTNLQSKYFLFYLLAVAPATTVGHRTHIVLGKPLLSVHSMGAVVATHTEAEPVPEPGLVSGPYVVFGGLL
jgi:hypothetical protein